jgi:hypothetical protein
VRGWRGRGRGRGGGQTIRRHDELQSVRGAAEHCAAAKTWLRARTTMRGFPAPCACATKVLTEPPMEDHRNVLDTDIQICKRTTRTQLSRTITTTSSSPCAAQPRAFGHRCTGSTGVHRQGHPGTPCHWQGHPQQPTHTTPPAEPPLTFAMEAAARASVLRWPRKARSVRTMSRRPRMVKQLGQAMANHTRNSCRRAAPGV